MRDIGIDRAELARRMGVPERELTRLLAGDRDMFTREMLEALAKTLGEDPGDGIDLSVHTVDMSA